MTETTIPTMREALGEIRLDQLRALINETEPGHIILPGGMNMMLSRATFQEPWVALSARELTVLLDELGALREGATPPSKKVGS